MAGGGASGGAVGALSDYVCFFDLLFPKSAIIDKVNELKLVLYQTESQPTTHAHDGERSRSGLCHNVQWNIRPDGSGWSIRNSCKSLPRIGLQQY